MPNPEHLEILKRGAEAWNSWRAANAATMPNLRKASLEKRQLAGTNLRDAYLRRASLCKTDLSGADLREANLSGADLRGADLTGSNLAGANLRAADLSGADLSGANLMSAILVGAKMCHATLTDCLVYGVSAWEVNLEGASQSGLVVTHPNQNIVTTDDLEVAQFIFLLLNNRKVRQVLDAVASKVVLILGRFTAERKPVLDALRRELGRRDYSPVLFDFDKPGSKDVTGTVETLARMAKFVVVDLTDPGSVPHELATVVPFLRTTPVLPLRLRGATGYSMFDDFRAYPWVLDTYYYEDSDSLIAAIAEVTAPAEEMVKRLRGK
jgi:hypothetical protein